MARIRTIKPQFFTSEDITRCSRDARLLFIGIWTEADRDGRLEDRPRQLQIRLFPGDDDVNVSILLEELHAAGLIDRYKVGTSAVIQVTGFSTHQRPHPKEPPSALPAKCSTSETVAKREPKVYFIRDESKSCIKIGVSYRPDFRLAGIQTGHSATLQLMGFCDGGFKVEKELHQKFADYRLNGEWFEESAELLRDIEVKCREKVVMLPVDNPSSPVGRSMEYGVSGREGVPLLLPQPQQTATAALIMSPAAYARRQTHCAFVGSRLDVPHTLHGELRKALGGADPDAVLQAWYEALNAEIDESGEAITPDVFKWLKARFAGWVTASARAASEAKQLARLQAIERGEIKR